MHVGMRTHGCGAVAMVPEQLSPAYLASVARVASRTMTYTAHMNPLDDMLDDTLQQVCKAFSRAGGLCVDVIVARLHASAHLEQKAGVVEGATYPPLVRAAPVNSV